MLRCLGRTTLAIFKPDFVYICRCVNYWCITLLCTSKRELPSDQRESFSLSIDWDAAVVIRSPAIREFRYLSNVNNEINKFQCVLVTSTEASKQESARTTQLRSNLHNSWFRFLPLYQHHPIDENISGCSSDSIILCLIP